MYQVPPEYDAALVTALDVFKFAAFPNAKVKQSAEVSVGSGPV